MKPYLKLLLRWTSGLLLFHGAATAQLPNPVELNTAADGTSSTFPIGSLDPNWTAAYGDPAGPTSTFEPAVVVGNCVPGWWYDSPFPNANWIAYDFGAGCDHSAQGCVDLFFRREITLPATDDCGLPIDEYFCLEMDFFADNAVYEIWVNGISNFSYTLPNDPYEYIGYQTITTVNLCTGWQPGPNELLIHIKSCPSSEGFLAQASFNNPNQFFHTVSLEETICEGEELFGYTSTGVYVDTTACDTIRTLDLTVNANAETKQQVTICPGTSYVFQGRLLASAGEYRDTLATFQGCDSVVVLDLDIFPHEFLGRDTTVCAANEYRLTGLSEQTRWFDHSVSKTKTVTKTGNYWASMTDVNGCEILDSVFVQFDAELYLPNAFSPNGDGINDFFLPYFSANGQAVTNLQFRVFDRWGGLVFSSEEVAGRGWDGTCRGTDCQPGTYVFLLEMETVHCGKSTRKGAVILLK